MVNRSVQGNGRQRGFTYLAVLFVVAVTGALAVAATELWSSKDRQLRQMELDFVGNQYSRAIRSFYLSSPGTVKRYPKTLEDLLEDRRQAGAVRHLRKLYLDPLTHQAFGLVRETDGGIIGVYSKADKFNAGGNRCATEPSSLECGRFIFVPSKDSSRSP